jgi:hypothetical protein
MPTSEEIVEQLRLIANHVAWLAIAWHAAVAIIAVALICGWRPFTPTVGRLIVAPVLSVFVVAMSFASWFNAAAFAVLAIVVATMMQNEAGRAQPRRRGWQLWIGMALVAYGIAYPHFVDGPWYRSIYAAPIGLVPCPTLAVVAGFALILQTPRSRVRCAVLAGFTGFYALFGMLRLGVWLDTGLFAATVALGIETLVSVRPHASSPIIASPTSV